MRHPLTRVLVFRPRRARRARRWLFAAVGTLLFTMAPRAAHAQGADSLVVSWTSSGDDERHGTAAGYDLRFSESPITSANFEAATAVSDLPLPAIAGTRQSATVRGLTRGTIYYFAIRSVDDAGNWSDLSNVLRWDWILDTAPPATPIGVAVARENESARVAWTPGSEPDLAGYRIYRATSATGPFSVLNPELVSAPPYVDNALPEGATSVWYQVSAVDGVGNESARSAAVPLSLGTATVIVAALEPAYPNPARGDAPMTIPIVMPDGAGEAVVDIVSSGGVRVRRIDVPPAAGRQEVVWDGRNDAGRLVAPGAYRAWLIAGKTRTSIRLVRVP